MAHAKSIGVKTRREIIKANGRKHQTWRLTADVAVECALKWRLVFRALTAVPPDDESTGNFGAASSSVAGSGNHIGQEGFTSSMQEQCPLKSAPDSISCLNTFDLEKKGVVSGVASKRRVQSANGNEAVRREAGVATKSHEAGVATKSRVHSADCKKHRIHVSKRILQTQLAAKETTQESALASADAPESSCASDNDKTSWRQNRTLPCSPEPGFANSFSADCSETSVGRAPLVLCDAPSGSGFVLSAPSASGKHTPVDRIPLRYQDLRRECQRVGIPITIVQDSRLGRKRHASLRKDELTRKLAAKVLCAPGCQDTQVDHSWNMHQLRKECQRVGIGLTHSEDTMDGRRRYVCLRKKDLVRQLAAHHCVKKKTSLLRYFSQVPRTASQAWRRPKVACLRHRQSQALPRPEAA